MRVLSADGHKDEVNVCEVPEILAAPLYPYYVLIQFD